MTVAHDGGVVDLVAQGKLYSDLVGTCDQRAVWAQMCRKAIPHLESFHMDLIHDWASLRVCWQPRDFTFWWSIRESGTTLSTDEDTFRQHHQALGGVVAYRVDVEFYDHGDDPPLRDVVFTPWEG